MCSINITDDCLMPIQLIDVGKMDNNIVCLSENKKMITKIYENKNSFVRTNE